MFKKTQKYLLLNYPLFWNTKIVPLSLILIIINIIFFALGYQNGAIDFTETNNSYKYDSIEPILVFIGVLISILILIIWLVLYFKNNSFKSFYPKNNFSLFKEWLIIFSVGFMIGMFAISYLYAKELRVRHYFTQEEAKKRCETLSLASIFFEGSFETKYHDTINSSGDTVQVANNYSVFKNKRYATNSLMNKNIESFQFFDQETDTLQKIKVRTWLYNDQKAKIKSILKNYLAIANEHHLKANIDENQWMQLVYNYPDFTEINIVGKSEKVGSYYDEYTDYEEVIVDNPIDNFDNTNKFKKKINNVDVEFYKHYVPAANLNYAYEKIADAWVSPNITWVSILFPLYFALGLSLLIFSFRVTSGKNWLITIVSLGIFNIVFGVISAVFSTEILYFVTLVFLILMLFIYFLFIINRKKGKSISAITLNGLLWLFGGFIPLIYALFIEFLKWKYDYRSYTGIDEMPIINPNKEMFDLIDLLKDSYFIMMAINTVFIFIFMFFISFKIQKWKGVAED